MKVMIVDDEVIIRTGLAQVIKWRELGLELLPPAESGEEAIERMRVERPHILLTDIRMTGMDGLQLAEEARKLLPNLEVIILSGFDDFAYTQQAIRNHVNDYLLKTTRPEEIIKAVLKAKHRIEQRWTEQSDDHFKTKEARNRLFERWIVNGDPAGIDARMLESVLPRLFAQEGRPNREGDELLQVFFVSGKGWENRSGASGALLLFAIENMLHDLLACETLLQADRVVVASRAGREASERDEAFRKIEELLKCKLFVAYGRKVPDLTALHESYRTAETAFGYIGLTPGNRSDYADIEHRKGGKTAFGSKDEIELHAILMEDDSVTLKEWTKRFVDSLLSDDQFTLESLEDSVQAVAVSAQRWIEKALTVTGRSGAAQQLPHYRFERGRRPTEALFQYLHTAMKLFHNLLGEGQAAYIHRAKAFIETHLGGDVGLPRVAKHVHLHPSHFSEIFKKEVGMTFSDYVTRQRMRQAADILTTSPAKISDVASSVGYEDVKYFGQIFKKHTGKTPSEYREDAARQEKLQ